MAPLLRRLQELGEAPEIEVKLSGEPTLSYIPSHIQYMLQAPGIP